MNIGPISLMTSFAKGLLSVLYRTSKGPMYSDQEPETGIQGIQWFFVNHKDKMLPESGKTAINSEIIFQIKVVSLNVQKYAYILPHYFHSFL